MPLSTLFRLSAALLLLSLTSPLLLLTAVILALSQKGAVFFWQWRAGYQGRPFVLYKFQTMRPLQPGFPLSDAERITPLGSLLRRWSIDELPQLWNVLRGDMHFVGPRPLLLAYNQRYSPYQKQRLQVKPGLTGLAQVKGRNALSWAHRFRYDVFYVKHRSFALNAYILLLTFTRVFNGRDVNTQAGQPMTEFKP